MVMHCNAVVESSVSPRKVINFICSDDSTVTSQIAEPTLAHMHIHRCTYPAHLGTQRNVNMHICGHFVDIWYSFSVYGKYLNAFLLNCIFTNTVSTAQN